MREESIRKLTKKDCEMLSEVLGYYYPEALQDYEGRYTKIILKSPKKVRGISGRAYRNGG